MAIQTVTERNPLWWTTLIVTITTTIIGTALRMLTGAVNTSSQEPSYFPLLFLIVAFGATLLVVFVYRMVLPELPSNWIVRGLLVGGFLFITGDLIYALLAGYETMTSPRVAQSLALASLINRLINGLILTYTYQRLSIRK